MYGMGMNNPAMLNSMLMSSMAMFPQMMLGANCLSGRGSMLCPSLFMGGQRSSCWWEDARRGGKGGKVGRSQSRDRSGQARSRDRSRSRHSGEDAASNTVKVPQSMVGRVIGKQGVIINEIRERSGARVQVHDSADGHSVFKITGTEEAIEMAKSMIVEVSEKNFNPLTDSADGDSNTVTETLKFDVSVMGALIGTKGSRIADIRHKSGAKVLVDKIQDYCKVEIIGLPERVMNARAMIFGVVEEGRKQGLTTTVNSEVGHRVDDGDDVCADNSASETLIFPASAAGALIGKGGTKVSEVRHASGAKVHIDKENECCKVNISGTRPQVDHAVSIVRQMAEESVHTTKSQPEADENMSVPKAVLGRVIGKGGETIHRLQRESGARISVSSQEQDPCILRLVGSHDAVAWARWMVLEVASPRDSSGSSPWSSSTELANQWGAWPAYSWPSDLATLQTFAGGSNPQACGTDAAQWMSAQAAWTALWSQMAFGKSGDAERGRDIRGSEWSEQRRHRENSSGDVADNQRCSEHSSTPCEEGKRPVVNKIDPNDI